MNLAVKYRAWQIKRAAKLLIRIDDYLQSKNISRHERRQFWRDVCYHAGARKKLLKKVME